MSWAELSWSEILLGRVVLSELSLGRVVLHPLKKPNTDFYSTTGSVHYIISFAYYSPKLYSVSQFTADSLMLFQ